MHVIWHVCLHESSKSSPCFIHVHVSAYRCMCADMQLCGHVTGLLLISGKCYCRPYIDCLALINYWLLPQDGTKCFSLLPVTVWVGCVHSTVGQTPVCWKLLSHLVLLATTEFHWHCLCYVEWCVGRPCCTSPWRALPLEGLALAGSHALESVVQQWCLTLLWDLLLLLAVIRATL